MKINYFSYELDVPEWANWICTNKNGQVWVFENKPVIEVNYWFKANGQRERVFTVVPLNWKNSLIQIQKAHVEPEQLTLRDHFAMSALNGLLSCADVVADKDEIVKYAYIYADLMIEARKRC